MRRYTLRIAAVLFFATAAVISFMIFPFEKADSLTISTDKGKTVFFSYDLLGCSLVGVGTNDNIMKYRFIDVGSDTLKLAGEMVIKGTEYAVVSGRTRVSIYTPSGRLKASYIPEDKQEHIISCCLGDINNDSGDELLIVSGKGNTFYGSRLTILAYDSDFRKLYQREYREFNPWKVQTADVDGDGVLDISLGVYKETPFNKEMDRRPFIFYWYKGDLVPKWRGSRLSRPFKDYVFFDIDKDGMAELVAAEYVKDGKMLLSAYKWRGFGFESMAESDTYEAVDDLKACSKADGAVYAAIKKNGRTDDTELVYSLNRLVEKEN